MKWGGYKMKKPIIGITSAHEKEEGLRNYHRTTLSIDYTKAVVAGGEYLWLFL